MKCRVWIVSKEWVNSEKSIYPKKEVIYKLVGSVSAKNVYDAAPKAQAKWPGKSLRIDDGNIALEI